MSSIDRSLIQLLTEGQILELKEVFEIFDIDQDGSISTDELGTIMRSLGQSVTEVELNDMISKVDTDENKCLDFSEFLLLMTQKMIKDDENYEYYRLFKLFDEDGNGVISNFELKLALMKCTTQEDVINNILSMADVDGDGNINFKEFVRFIKLLPQDNEDY